MSPELLHPERFGIPESEGDRPTKQSDCYALGMVIYEVGPHTNWSVVAKAQIPQVLCGHHPYLEFQSDILAANAIMVGARPKKPKAGKRLGFSDELWRTVEMCWSEDRDMRPRVAVILSCLNTAAWTWCMREF